MYFEVIKKLDLNKEKYLSLRQPVKDKAELKLKNDESISFELEIPKGKSI